MAALERALLAVDAREHEVHAWAHLDADGARRAAAALDDGPHLPLSGLVIGVKDVIDTADQPTAYGSPIYDGHRPVADAAVVALLRRAGAVVLGKTVTAELAMYAPGPTANPHRTTHTPGGSSSGSAAAVACGMADVALGTQTAGSVIRPASFCGVWGYKPTYGSVPIAGVLSVAASLDTVGWFAGSVEVLDRVRTVLTGRAPVRLGTEPPTIGVARTAAWEAADPDSRAAVEAAAARAADLGATVVDVELQPALDGLAEDGWLVQAYEAAHSLAWGRAQHGDRLSAGLREILALGDAVDPEAYDDVRRRAGLARFDPAPFISGADVLLTPAVVGEAPEGLASTGSPAFCRLWTLLGWPAVSVPGAVGATGLPIGVQLVAPFGSDADLLAAAAWLA